MKQQKNDQHENNKTKHGSSNDKTTNIKIHWVSTQKLKLKNKKNKLKLQNTYK